MLAHAIFFYTFSFIAIVSAIMVTVSKNTVHSVFFLILDFISISCLFIMIGAEFLGMIMLIIYVGAVAVLFLFVVMMLNVAQQKNQWFSAEKSSKHIPIGLIVSVIIFFELLIVIGGWKYKPDLVSAMSLTIDKNITNTHSIGYVLYTDYIHSCFSVKWNDFISCNDWSYCSYI
jgi:NADH-quinone oxidoreductase subunit J